MPSSYDSSHLLHVTDQRGAHVTSQVGKNTDGKTHSLRFIATIAPMGWSEYSITQAPVPVPAVSDALLLKAANNEGNPIDHTNHGKYPEHVAATAKHSENTAANVVEGPCLSVTVETDGALSLVSSIQTFLLV